MKSRTETSLVTDPVLVTTAWTAVRGSAVTLE